MRALGPDPLLVIIPAFNEEGAIATVVKSVRQTLPETPVLVLDDCSGDSTATRARAAGAEVLSLPAPPGSWRMRTGRLQTCVRAWVPVRYPRGRRRAA